jgi:hypothetical protein
VNHPWQHGDEDNRARDLERPYLGDGVKFLILICFLGAFSNVARAQKNVSDLYDDCKGEERIAEHQLPAAEAASAVNLASASVS